MHPAFSFAYCSMATENISSMQAMITKGLAFLKNCFMCVPLRCNHIVADSHGQCKHVIAPPNRPHYTKCMKTVTPFRNLFVRIKPQLFDYLHKTKERDGVTITHLIEEAIRLLRRERGGK